VSRKTEARDLLLSMIAPAAAALARTTPENAVADAVNEALLNQPALRTCLFPDCLRQFDAITCMAGEEPPRPEWSGKGWATLGTGSIVAGGGHVCPDHRQLITGHLPRRLELPDDRWSLDCPCGWSPTPQRYYRLLQVLWEEHLLTETGKLPPAPPVTDPEHRIPLAEHTEDTLTELYDRLWDAETSYQECREVARACSIAYSAAVPALLGAKTALEALRTRITVDSRDWAHDKLDALLWAVLVGWNCENTDDGHVHNDIDCAGDQGLWNIATQHSIPTDQTIQASQHRWWIANAIKTAQQIEDSAKQQEVN
jgi:hypothetical protein